MDNFLQIILKQIYTIKNQIKENYIQRKNLEL